MVLRPRIANIDCSKIRFQPGDRLLVRSFHRLDKYDKEKLRKSIQKWAGEGVRILIICTQDLDISIEQQT